MLETDSPQVPAAFQPIHHCTFTEPGPGCQDSARRAKGGDAWPRQLILKDKLSEGRSSRESDTNQPAFTPSFGAIATFEILMQTPPSLTEGLDTHPKHVQCCKMDPHYRQYGAQLNMPRQSTQKPLQRLEAHSRWADHLAKPTNNTYGWVLSQTRSLSYLVLARVKPCGVPLDSVSGWLPRQCVLGR